MFPVSSPTTDSFLQALLGNELAVLHSSTPIVLCLPHKKPLHAFVLVIPPLRRLPFCLPKIYPGLKAHSKCHLLHGDLHTITSCNLPFSKLLLPFRCNLLALKNVTEKLQIMATCENIFFLVDCEVFFFNKFY